VGEDFDEHLLGGMADEGGGHFLLRGTRRSVPRVHREGSG
jgi:hypothetical protein